MWLRVLTSLSLCAVLTGCGHVPVDSLAPNTAGTLDFKRYQGKWYELARLPMAVQQDCAQAETHYNLKPDGTLGVLSRCRTLGDEWLRSEGHAWPQRPDTHDKLWVEFDNRFTRVLPGFTKADYWILYVDERYRTALVGTPDHRHLWILSRSSTLPAWQRERLLAKAREQGYDTRRLMWRVSDRDIVAQH